MDRFELELHCASFQNSEIYTSILSGRHDRVLRAIQNGQDIRVKDEEFGMTYLHLVTMAADTINEQCYVPMIYQLSNAGIEVNAENHNGETALHSAITKNLEDLMVALFRVGCEFRPMYKTLIQQHAGPFELSATMWHDKFHPGLWQAVAANDFTMVMKLVSYWCRINISDPNYGTLRKYAKMCGASKDITRFLMEKEATLEVVHAVLAGDERRLTNLRSNNACDLTILDESYQANFLKPVAPRSLHETAQSMGFKHLLLALPQLSNSGDMKSQQNEKPSSQICALM